MTGSTLTKSAFANIDGRARCITPGCWGDLLLMPTGQQDIEGIPSFLPQTVCPLCMRSYPVEQDMTDRQLYLRVSWLQANPHASEDDIPDSPPT